ncbi:ABC transporter permease [Sulfolobus sp. E11-6]|uniref:ABC transporter permease n=1 Tax=Sulfolobus sp. E11-6 TaxID=2663020 RepID=UPI001294F728|nr:FtsX-like permease family protein [Sulfolobus sp. E11-6]QGA69137.1 FtsX-like permease family protein [Sulfolobus sp. E11-6]
MNGIDILWLAYKGLMARKTLALISIIAIMIGITSVSFIEAFSQGVERSVISTLFQLNPTNIYVFNEIGYVSPTDVSLMSSLPGVDAVYPVIEAHGVVQIGGRVINVLVVGVDNISSLLGKVELENGTVYPPVTVPYAVIGHDIAHPIPDVTVQPGSTIILKLSNGNTVPLTVYGILRPSESVVIGDTSDVIFIPLSEAKALVNPPGYFLVVLQGSSISEVNTITTLLNYIYGNSLTVTTIQQAISSVQVIITSFSFLVILIGSISLFVGAVGIMGITLARVYQRTREIGIMKTVGLTTRQVLLVFLLEALIVGVLGGIVGLTLTVMGTYVMDINGIPFNAGSSNGSNLIVVIRPFLSMSDVGISILIALVTSIIAGIYPAWKASKLTVIEAVRKD